MLETLRRRIRGILGTGAIWGTLGGLVGTLVGFVVGVFHPPSQILGSMLELGGALAFVGLLSGVGFGAFISLVAAREGDRLRLGPGRGALLGMLGALTLPALIISQIPAGPRFTTNFLGIIATYAAIGAVSGALFLRAGGPGARLSEAESPGLLPGEDT